ncbi:MAG: thioredoxin family protein [Roseovarius sp.]|nr:thioredoxin family protein [Roseovarius sp.]MCY4207295.1 thioredoxin family protein [Roseovarius sp.]MCY4291381.1 thioredoxin family protein [Roseovarius sp.]MCY4314793.1 thioredoxin family protein [Roseovarius sp.]
MRKILRPISLALFLMFSPATAAELIMVESRGCHHCREWKSAMGHVYPKTREGKFAPLRIVDIADGPPGNVKHALPVVFTPTFILTENGRELGRITGNPGEDFFWWLLGKLLSENTDFDNFVDSGKKSRD